MLENNGLDDSVVISQKSKSKVAHTPNQRSIDVSNLEGVSFLNSGTDLAV